jgi:uncharacterized protein DUF5649
LRDDGSFSLGTLTTSSLTLQTDGTITQTGVVTAPTLTLTASTAGNGTFNLGTQNNLIGNASTSNQVNSVALRDDAGLNVAGINAAGNVTLTTNGGAVTQSGNMTVGGTTTVTAGAAPITLTMAGNDFQSAVTLSNSGANAVQIVDMNNISIASSTMGGDFTVTANGGAGTITLGSITNTGMQQYNGNAVLNNTYTTNGGAFAITGTTILASDTTIDTSSGNVTFGSTINSQTAGVSSLTVNDGGANNFMGAIGNATALANITTNAPGTSVLGGNVTVTATINFLDVTTANGVTMTSTGGGAIVINNANTTSPAFVSTTGDVTFQGLVIGTSGAPLVFIVTPNALTLTQQATAFFNGPAIPGSVIFPTGASITFNNALIAQSFIQQQAASAASQASSSIAAVIVEEANKTFGTDSVAEDVEYGFAGEIGATPPMDHRIDESGISLPRCVQEAREGMPCK